MFDDEDGALAAVHKPRATDTSGKAWIMAKTYLDHPHCDLQRCSLGVLSRPHPGAVGSNRGGWHDNTDASPGLEGYPNDCRQGIHCDDSDPRGLPDGCLTR